MSTRTKPTYERVAEAFGTRLSPAERWLHSAAGKALRERGELTDEPVAVRSAEELATRAVTSPDGMATSLEAPMAVQPRPADILDYVTVVPFDLDNAGAVTKRQEDDGATEDAASHTYGADPSTTSAFASSSVNYSGSTERPDRIVTSANVPEDVFEDAGATRFILNDFVDNVVRQEIARQVLKGSGTSGELDGLVPNAGATYTRDSANSEALHDAIRKGATLVQAKGYRSVVAVANAATWEKVSLEKDSSGLYLEGARILEDAITARVLSEALADDEVAIIASHASSLWLAEPGVSITLSDSHNETFLQGHYTLRGLARATAQPIASSVAVVNL